jgi:hypothetical protein
MTRYHCLTCGTELETETADCLCGKPATIALNLYRRLHMIHKQQNPSHALTKEIGNVCDELLELAALLQADK